MPLSVPVPASRSRLARVVAPALLALCAAAATLAPGSARAGYVEDEWFNYAMDRCTTPVMNGQPLVTDGLTKLSTLEANRIDIRSGGDVWTSPAGWIRVIPMTVQIDGEAFRGCRIGYPDEIWTSVNFNITQLRDKFESWIANNVSNRQFRDIDCQFGPRVYARKIKTRSEVRPGVQVSIVMEIGQNDSFVFFAAVEEPVGVGECLNES